MQDKKDPELGKVKIHHEAISTISSQAVSGINGLVKLSGNIVENIAERLGRKTFDKGIRTKVLGEDVKVDVSVIVEYGTKIPEIAWQIQNNITKAIEEMTGLHVSSVNVNIEGVELPKKDKPQSPAVLSKPKTQVKGGLAK